MEYSELRIMPQIDRNATCSFTGNRPHRLPWINEEDERCKTVKAKIRQGVEQAVKSGKILFVCGMAEGADMYFAEAVIALKEKYDIYLEAALPYPEFEKYRSLEERERYQRIVDKCDFVTVISPVGSKYAPLKRNRYMVDKSSLLIALNYSEKGGTAYTIEYAEKKGLKIVKIND